MSWINHYTYQAMIDQQERGIARLSESNWQVRRASELVARAAHQHCDPESGAASEGAGPSSGSRTRGSQPNAA